MSIDLVNRLNSMEQFPGTTVNYLFIEILKHLYDFSAFVERVFYIVHDSFQ